jgi:signal transduction histidine kinase
VIFVTAIHDAREHMARGYEHGAVDYVSKPFDPEFLAAKVSWFVSLWQRGVLLKRQERLIQEREREAAREQALREAAEAATRAKDELLAMVSHDLLTPLTAIIGWAEMIKKGMLDPPHVEKAVDTILHCAGAQRDLIEDLLDISRVIAGKLDVRPAPIDLREVVERVVQTLAPSARAGGIEIAVVCGSPAPVLGDAERLEQLIGNLMQNAIKFSKPGGRVELSLRNDSGNLILRVRDWGAGIPAELLPHVFERYKQGADGRARGGLGLGLAIARHLAELHGGVIEAASAGEGQGASFTLKLPLRRAAASHV